MAFSYSYTMDGGGVAGGKAIYGFLSIDPWYSVIKIPMFSTIVINFGNRVEQRIAQNDSPQYKFQLKWGALSPVNANRILEFFVARRGSFEAFYWTNPVDTTSYLVRFLEDELNAEYFAFQLYRFNRVEFLEVSE
jgi:phage-related protein